MPAARADKSSTFTRLAERRALALLVEPPAPVFYLGLALGIIAAIVALLIVVIP
jgi:hypothetical protein